MYYEERWINGELKRRTTPKGPWHILHRYELLERIREQEGTIEDLVHAQEGDNA